MTEAPKSGRPPLVRFTGVLFWPVSAGISLFGTTSIAVSALSRQYAPSTDFPFVQAVGMFLAIFFLGALLSSVVGGTTLAIDWRYHPCTVELRGRRVSERMVRAVLILCYASPWMLVASSALFMPRVIR